MFISVTTLLYFCTDLFDLTSFLCTDYPSDYLSLLTPVMVYSNTDTEKTSILKQNKGRSGVYR